MAKITLKCFGVFATYSNFDKGPVEADTLSDVVDFLNKSNAEKEKIVFTKALVYLNGEPCGKKNKKLKDGDEVWLLSAFTGEKKEKPKKEKAVKDKKGKVESEEKSA
ncbi:MAG TPA: MoaD/ThiS family protein [Clostridiales bacterium]|jgi:molybdopterin converting factor small subunit|nr:MoaD/ThiS family protein [Clostridiales bacterium]